MVTSSGGDAIAGPHHHRSSEKLPLRPFVHYQSKGPFPEVPLPVEMWLPLIANVGHGMHIMQ
jgi:hypothetical protein